MPTHDQVIHVGKLFWLLDAQNENEAHVAFTKLREFATDSGVTLRSFRVVSQTQSLTDIAGGIKEAVGGIKEASDENQNKVIEIQNTEIARLQNYCEKLEVQLERMHQQRAAEGQRKERSHRKPVTRKKPSVSEEADPPEDWSDR